MVSATARQPDAARALIKNLTTPEAAARDLIARGDPNVINCGIEAILRDVEYDQAMVIEIFRATDRELERRRISGPKLTRRERRIHSAVQALVKHNDGEPSPAAADPPAEGEPTKH